MTTAPVRPAKPRPPWGLWAGLLVALTVTIWAGWSIGFTLEPLLTDIGRGAPILETFLHPNWSFLGRIWEPWIETLSIAVVASVVGCGIALILSFMASPVAASGPVMVRVTRFILSVIRSLPDVAYGLIFVAAVGVGSLAGVLALIAFNLGVCAKLTSESIDAVDTGPIEAADAAGASLLQRARAAILPQVLPGYLSYSLYVFELNVRASVVIGIVGGGGIGSIITVQLGRFSYENLSAVIIALFAVVFAIDSFSRWLRQRLI